MARILVVGGAGYVGGTTTDLLCDNGHKVVVYDSLVYETRYLKPVEFIWGDVRDYEKLGKLIGGFDIVIWLAALVGDAACAIDPFLTRSINVSPVRWLAYNFGGKIVFPSTCSVYGVNNDLIDEAATPNPISVYAKTKLAAEQLLLDKRPDALVFRLGTLYGLGDPFSRVRFDLVVNVLAKRAALGQILSINGGEQWRPLLHVRDVAMAINFGLVHNIRGLFNLKAENRRIQDLANDIRSIVPDAKVQFNDLPFEDLRNYRVRSDKYELTGWSPQFTVTEGIDQIVKAIRERRIRDTGDSVYSNAEFLRTLRLGDLLGGQRNG